MRKAFVGLGTALMIWTPLFWGEGLLKAQEAKVESQKGPCRMCGKKEEEKGHHHGRAEERRAQRQRMHGHMEAMHHEMMRELWEQVAALREHSRAMEGVADEKQLLTEVRKHLQMLDEFLVTLLEQRERMHVRMREHRRRMREKKAEGKAAQEKGEEKSQPDS